MPEQSNPKTRPRRRKTEESFFEAVHAEVRRIPRGRVASYGQIGLRIGRPGSARTVGWAMRALPRGSDVPWHRVVNAQGRVSLTERSGSLQKALLEAEGVRFDENGRIDLDVFGWKPV